MEIYRDIEAIWFAQLAPKPCQQLTETHPKASRGVYLCRKLRLVCRPSGVIFFTGAFSLAGRFPSARISPATATTLAVHLLKSCCGLFSRRSESSPTLLTTTNWLSIIFFLLPKDPSSGNGMHFRAR